MRLTLSTGHIRRRNRYSCIWLITLPHFPLHAPKEVTDKYMSLYMQGWDKIRDARWKRIVDLKLMQGKPELSPRGVVPESLFEDETHPLPAWDSLTKDQQTDLARRMSILPLW